MFTQYTPPVDWHYLAATPAGRAALAIYERVIAVQDQEGLLLTRQRQVTVDMPEGPYAMVSARDTAYWFPDGRCGPWPPIADRQG